MAIETKDTYVDEAGGKEIFIPVEQADTQEETDLLAVETAEEMVEGQEMVVQEKRVLLRVETHEGDVGSGTRLKDEDGEDEDEDGQGGEAEKEPQNKDEMQEAYEEAEAEAEADEADETEIVQAKRTIFVYVYKVYDLVLNLFTGEVRIANVRIEEEVKESITFKVAGANAVEPPPERKKDSESSTGDY